MTRLAAAALSVLAACAGTETGNPSFEGTLGYTSHSSDSQAVALRNAGGVGGASITVIAAWLVLGDVRFVPSDDCNPEADAPVAAHALGAGDHARGPATHTPLELAPGRYCGLRLPLVRAPAALDAAPVELADHSIFIDGQLEDGARFELRSTLQRELFLAAESGDGFVLDAELPAVLIGFDAAAWLDGLSWEDAERDDQGAIAIDEQHNRALLERFEANLPDGIALFRDPGARGMIDEGARLAGVEP